MSKLDTEGSSAMEVDCVATGARPEPSFKWFIGGEEIKVRLKFICSGVLYRAWQNVVSKVSLSFLGNSTGRWAIYSCSAARATYKLQEELLRKNKQNL